MNDPTPFEINLATTPDGREVKLATNGAARMLLDDPSCLMMRRRSITRRPDPANPDAMIVTRGEWVYCEMDGVRVYFDGTTVVVSRQDLTP